MEWHRFGELKEMIELACQDSYEAGLAEGKKISTEDAWAEGYREGWDDCAEAEGLDIRD